METIAPPNAALHEALLDQASRVLVRDPADAEAHFVRGTALNALNRPKAARAALTRAVVLCPGMAAGWLNLGNACVDLDDVTAAERHYRRAIRLDPVLAEAWVSLGHLLLAQARVEDAIMACEAAVRLNPALAAARWNLALALLLSGDLPRGFQHYESRKLHPDYRADFPPLTGPQWDGGTVAGKVILVRAEQGLGDTIQFTRFLPEIVRRGGTPVLICDPRLVRLLSGISGVVVLPRTSRVEGYDAWIDLMSLPLVLGTDLDSLPAAGGYLAPCEAFSPSPCGRGLGGGGDHAEPSGFTPPPDPLPQGEGEKMGVLPAATLPACNGSRTGLRSTLRIGLGWAGNPAQANDRRRSIPPEALAPLLRTEGITFVNLQVGARASETGLTDLSAELPDFAATAAVIATLDLVIAVDSAVAHLAGALGAPVWVLLAYAPDWRWLLGREDSPWYASATLFRQATPGDWDGVIARVRTALGRFGVPDPENRGTARRPRFAPGH